MTFLAEAAPLAGRLAFAGVFLALIIWLLLMPKVLRGEAGTSGAAPLWRQARTWALATATLQLLIYLFWK